MDDFCKKKTSAVQLMSVMTIGRAISLEEIDLPQRGALRAANPALRLVAVSYTQSVFLPRLSHHLTQLVDLLLLLLNNLEVLAIVWCL